MQNDKNEIRNATEIQPQTLGCLPKIIIFVAIILFIIFFFQSCISSKGSNEHSTMSEATNYLTSDEEEEQVPKIVKIYAQYEGSTEKGEKLNEKNDDIKVMAVWNDGTETQVDNFKITNPTKLVAEKTSTINITYAYFSCTLKVKCTSLTAKHYKQKCKSIPYKKLARYPDKYEGKKVKFTGKIVQVIEDDYSNPEYRIDVTKDAYGLWEDTIYVEFYGKTKTRFLEDDIVSIYGESGGLYTYKTVLGAEVTIPIINAEYMKLIK